MEMDEGAAQRIDRIGERIELDQRDQPFRIDHAGLRAGQRRIEREDRTRQEIERQDHHVGEDPEALEAADAVGDDDAERGQRKGEQEHQGETGGEVGQRHREVGEAGERQHQRAVKHGDGGAAENLAQQDRGARHGRDQHLAQEAELAIPDDGDRRLHRGVHDVEGDHGREQELHIGVGHHEAHLAVDLAAEIRVEADAHDQHIEQRAHHAADQLAAVADGALHLAQPDGVEPARPAAPARAFCASRGGEGGGLFRSDCVCGHRVCSPPRLPNS